MDFAKILAQLREELKNVDAAIQTLERLQQSTRRRSRPTTDSDASTEEGLERRRWRLAPIMAEYEFVEVNLELITTDTVMGSE